MTSAPNPFTSRWYVAEDDLVGGWCIVLEDVSRVSDLSPTAPLLVASLVSSVAMAEWICALHNERIGHE